MNYENIYDRWNTFKTQDQMFKESLLNINKQNQFKKAFSSSIKIHNSKIIAKMGAHTNNLNEFTIAAIAQHYGKFISTQKDFQNRGVIVGHDNRINSELYALTFIQNLNKIGIKAFAFNKNLPTPVEFVPFTIKSKNYEGGISISYSGYYKSINSITFFKKNANLLDENDVSQIQENILNTNYLTLNILENNNIDNIQNAEIEFLTKEIENEFINSYTSMYESNLEKKLKIRISNLNGTSEIFNKIISKLGFENKEIFSERLYGKKINPWLLIKKNSYTSSNPKSLSKAIWEATISKSNFCIAINPDSSKFSIAIKHKKRFKYLTSTQIAAIYLKYILEDNKKEINKNSVIVKSFGTGSLINLIAKKHNIEVIETFHDLNFNSKKNILLALNDDFGYYDYKSFSNTRDAFSILLTIIEAANYYLNTQNKNLFDIVRSLDKEYNVHRLSNKNKIMPNDVALRFLDRINNSEKIGSKKIINKQIYKENKSNGLNQVFVLKLIDLSTITIKYNSGDKRLNLSVEVIGKKNEELMDVVIVERQIYNDIEELNEQLKVKMVTGKEILKYSIFAAILALIFYFLFETIYNLNGNPGSIFEDISNLIWRNKVNLYIFLSLISFSVVGIVIHSWALKRMLLILGHKVKFKDLFVGAYMGIAITAITPLPGGGGDIITYWYLRRKGVDRPALYASLLMGSLVYQIVLVLATTIFLPIGIVFYENIFANLNSATITLIVFLVIGTIFDVFGAVMITLISINKRIQQWIVKTSIKILEWIPFIIISDPGSTASRFQYEFNEIRKGIKLLVAKKRYIYEQVFYRFIPWFLSATATMGAIIFQNAGKIKPDIPAGVYFNILSGSSLVRAANSISITPGGSGTIDLFTTRIFQNIFTSSQESAVFSLMDRMANLVIPTLLSSLMIFTIYFGERRVDKINSENHNQILLKNNSAIKKTFFYRYAFIFWILFFLIFLIVISFL